MLLPRNEKVLVGVDDPVGGSLSRDRTPVKKVPAMRATLSLNETAAEDFERDMEAPPSMPPVRRMTAKAGGSEGEAAAGANAPAPATAVPKANAVMRFRLTESNPPLRTIEGMLGGGRRRTAEPPTTPAAAEAADIRTVLLSKVSSRSFNELSSTTAMTGVPELGSALRKVTSFDSARTFALPMPTCKKEMTIEVSSGIRDEGREVSVDTALLFVTVIVEPSFKA